MISDSQHKGKKQNNIFEMSQTKSKKIQQQSQRKEVLKEYIEQNTSQFFLLETHNFFKDKKLLKRLEITIQKGVDNLKSMPELNEIWNETTLLQKQIYCQKGSAEANINDSLVDIQDLSMRNSIGSLTERQSKSDRRKAVRIELLDAQKTDP